MNMNKMTVEFFINKKIDEGAFFLKFQFLPFQQLYFTKQEISYQNKGFFILVSYQSCLPRIL